MYDEQADINYIYLLMLYELCQYNATTNQFDTISYSSIKSIVNQCNSIFGDYSISSSTIVRMLSDSKYSNYLLHNKKDKTIVINNNVNNFNKFVVLNTNEFNLIMQYKDNLFIKYLLYHKYYCGYSRAKKHDSTAKQILAAIGYSTSSNSYLSKFSEYNKILSDNKMLSINKYRDQQGNERNVYSYYL